MNYKGVIIEESLIDTSALREVRILDTKVEQVTERHKTPWLKQWTLHTVEVPEEKAEEIAQRISNTLDYSHGTSWYADFKNNKTHFIIFKDKIFKIDRAKLEEYQSATDYGISLGIPDYLVDFSPHIKKWER